MIFSFDLGDFLIHEKYGIGVFVGIENICINDTSLDFFRIRYLDDSFLLVPSYNISVFKFHSKKDASTQINSLKPSDTFFKKKQKIKEEILKNIENLSSIYKKRCLINVPSFKMNSLYSDFCKNFPYSLTNGQNKALLDIVSDLSKNVPMDRLLCADVGFGKTEVASRAIALVLSNGYKALFVVPTTVLAFQHFETLKKRYSFISKRCEYLSKLNIDSKKIKQDWKSGLIDVLITTASNKGIESFFINSLGLIVLDEEHHFGVKFKENLSLKAHFLQLSATPIPRTLHLALSKIKDISLIETPPKGKKDINLKLVSINEIDINSIIKTEIKNKGKVFLVVPRIEYIQEIVSKLHSIEYTILHGQLSKEESNKAIQQFLIGNSGVLVSTNIIESGLNILSANLMIIFYAHMFGVAQLHQLKGRVGRGEHQGLVYMILPDTIKDVAAERIEMVEKNFSLGKGLDLSMQDMNFRGAGTVVGYKQSGKDYGLGSEMYFEIVNEVLENKVSYNNDKKIAWVGFMNAFIPSDYIVDQTIRFSFYKKLSSVSKLNELDDLVQDIQGNFKGEAIMTMIMPSEFLNFLKLIEINLLTKYLNITKVVRLNEDTFDVFLSDIPLYLYDKLDSSKIFEDKIRVDTSILRELISCFENFAKIS